MVLTHGKKTISVPVSKLETILGVDKRALAVFRFFVGFIGMVDILERWPDIKAHYSDEGFLPRAVVADNYWNTNWFSFHLMSGAVPFMQFLFLVNIVICFSVMIGYRSRLSMFLHYIFVLSLQARNNIVGHGGDVYMRVISYFAFFLPIGSVWSIDSAFKRNVLRRETKKYNITNFASFAIILQIFFLYVFSYVHKTGDEWRKDYTATYFALQLDYFRTFAAEFALNFPVLLKFMTVGVLYYEGFGILLCLSPVWTAPLKIIGALGFFMLHVGFGLFMRLGIFSPICATGSLLLFPTYLWDKIMDRVRTKERCDFQIYYNGRPGYIMAALASTFFLLPEVEVGPAPSSSDEKESRLMDGAASESIDIGTPHGNWIITKDHKGIRHTGVKALASICRASPLLWPISRVLEIRMVQYYLKKSVDFVERTVNKVRDEILVVRPQSPSLETNNHHQQHYYQNNHHQYPVLESIGGSVPDEATNHYYRRLNRKVRFIKMSKHAFFNVVALASILLALGWNCNTVDCGLPIGLPPQLNWVLFSLRLDQMWSMFSPRPPAIHWWYTFEGELDDGTQMEMWNNEGLFTWKGNPAPYSREKPYPYAPCIGNHRWFKVYENMNTGGGYELIRLGMGRWVCREWNLRHQGNERLHKFNIVYRNEKQHLDGTRSPLNDIVLWSHVCYEKPAIVAPTIPPPPVTAAPQQIQQNEQQQQTQQQTQQTEQIQQQA
ncbi:hypothetical protein DFA_04621 [Cavenderia fasciculata]|uniref:HTTM-like domain-containing protein n=1 Tax=Cavenderia fasciculata TaxID=261658 RepID=F4PQ30_CACFS|nr:uncharacterized protein DFA_04621 [Cavenderia fasciculata]EGG22493.1 hypothetical protein DFA_04621 [Cavenderia fasciculata]|eukprot:XP_004360344.1 hypothetical protein DFA_04621 [Cavenderia fasciculata]